MTYWTCSDGGYLNACLASLVGCHPADVPHADDDYLDLPALNRWLADKGRRLEPVYASGTWGESYPAGLWIALLARRPGVCHAVVARRNEIVHDPGVSDGGAGPLWPTNLATAGDSTHPLGFVLAEAA